MTRTRLAILGIVGVIVATLLWSTAKRVYFQPRQLLLEQIAQAEERIKRREKVIAGEVAQRRQLRDAAARTLGGNQEQTISALRSRLNTIGHGIGLADLRVSTSTVKPVSSPARLAHRDSAWRQLAAEPDFYLVSADFSGQGTFAQAVRALEILAAEPYVKRIERFTLRPRQGGEAVDLSVSLATIILADSDPAPLSDPDLSFASSYAPLASKNLFRAPPPAPDPPPVQPEVKPQVVERKPPPVPYGDWVVTGIVWIDQQPELWLENRKNNQSRQLRSGDRILDVQVEEITLTQAVVSIEGAKFYVEIGQSLGDRRPVNQ